MSTPRTDLTRTESTRTESARSGDAPRSAVALRWSPVDVAAPRVTAKGRGEVADAILAAARAHGVPVREDRDLCELLAGCELLDEIPPELYAGVARILTWLHGVNRDLADAAERSPVAGADGRAQGERARA